MKCTLIYFLAFYKEVYMPYFMHQWRYKDPQFRAMVDKPQDRAETVKRTVEAFDGKLHRFYFAFGDYDGIAIAEFPDNKCSAACLMTIVGGGGLESVKTTVLLTTEEASEAMELAHDKISGYEPPSGPSGL
jgi:uncharacterized protein with GYD domain